MTHKQLVALIHKRLHGAVTHGDIERVFTEFACITADELGRGEIVTVRDIGTLTALAVAERMGTNPKTGEKILLPASKRVKLKPCVALKTRVQ